MLFSDLTFPKSRKGKETADYLHNIFVSVRLAFTFFNAILFLFFFHRVVLFITILFSPPFLILSASFLDTCIDYFSLKKPNPNK